MSIYIPIKATMEVLVVVGIIAVRLHICSHGMVQLNIPHQKDSIPHHLPSIGRSRG